MNVSYLKYVHNSQYFPNTLILLKSLEGGRLTDLIDFI